MSRGNIYPNSPEVGDIWEEVLRPGHTVRILEYIPRKPETPTPMLPEHYGSVKYEHVGVYNKRAQRHPTLSNPLNFVRRYVLKERAKPKSRHEVWNEGYLAGFGDGGVNAWDPTNPYPEEK